MSSIFGHKNGLYFWTQKWLLFLKERKRKSENIIDEDSPEKWGKDSALGESKVDSVGLRGAIMRQYSGPT
jgi:hypothetical protein